MNFNHCCCVICMKNIHVTRRRKSHVIRLDPRVKHPELPNPTRLADPKSLGLGSGLGSGLNPYFCTLHHSAFNMFI